LDETILRSPYAVPPVCAPDDATETEGAGKDRPPHMDVEAQIAAAGLVIEIEAAIPEMQVQPRAGGIIDGADELPVDMGANPETAEITVGGQAEAVAKVAVITPAEQRIGPAGGAVYRCCGKEPAVQVYVHREPPGAKPNSGIHELHRVLELAVENHPGAGIRPHLGIAALKQDVTGRDVGAHGQMDDIAEKAQAPVSDFQ
jgi:hypothetical protein